MSPGLPSGQQESELRLGRKTGVGQADRWPRVCQQRGQAAPVPGLVLLEDGAWELLPQLSGPEAIGGPPSSSACLKVSVKLRN